MQLQFVCKFTLTFSLTLLLVILFCTDVMTAKDSIYADSGFSVEVGEDAGLIYESARYDSPRIKTVEYEGYDKSKVFTSSHDVDFNDKAVTPFFPRPELIVFALGLLFSYFILNTT